MLTLSKVESGTLNKLEARSIEDDGLRGVVEDLDDVADVQVKTGRSQITLIANVAESSNVMAVVFQVMSALGVQVETQRLTPCRTGRCPRSAVRT